MGKGRKTGGRKPGTPNRVTVDVREALRTLAQGLAPRVQGWLTEVAESDPGRALDLYLRALEFTVPRMARLHVDISTLTDEEILQELEARIARQEASPMASAQDVRTMSVEELSVGLGPGSVQA